MGKCWPNAHLPLVLNKSEMNLIWLGREKWGGHSMGAGGGDGAPSKSEGRLEAP